MRSFVEGVIIALQSIAANKLRSVLTLIGMVIGVTTVIAVVSVINGMNNYVAVRINSLGSNTFVIDKFGMITTNEDFFDAMKHKDITMEDLRAVERGCELCENVGGSIQSSRRVKYGSDYLEDVTVEGSTYNFTEVSNVETEYGRTLDQNDEAHRSAVCLIGADVAANLIKTTDPLGKDIKIGNYMFRIVGVLKRIGSTFGVNEDIRVIMPLTTFNKYFGRRHSITLYAKARDIKFLEEAQDQARMIMRTRHRIRYDQKDDFGIMTAGSIMSFFRDFTRVAWFVLVLISSVSLVVGGIVIMNIMLVSVTERTREVGIRKAIGARKRDILWQFLIEAVTVAIVGGAIGVLLGAALALTVKTVTPLPASIETWAVMSGLGVSSFVGIVFGLFPALKAARLDPIESLRYE